MIKEKIKNNYGFILLFLFIGMMFYLHSFIYLGGDDYIYGTFIKDGLDVFWNKHINHYMKVNGRAIMHFLVTIMLIFDMHLWRFINPISICIFIILLSKISTKDNKNLNSAILVGIMLVAFIGIDITRETIFWLDGSFNYFYPMLLLLLNVYLSRKVINENKNYIWLPIIGFISGATVEQVGLMTFGILFMMLVDKVFIKKEKINKIYYINFIFTIIGYLTIVLAPGNRVRISNNKSNIFYNIIEISRLNLSDGIQIFIILLMSSVILWLIHFIKEGYNVKLNKILTTLMCINILVYSSISCFTKFITLFANKVINNSILVTDSIYELTGLVLKFIYDVNINNLFGSIIWAILVISIIYTLSMLIYISIYIYKNKGETTFISFLTVAIGAQVMMIISPVYGFRTIFPTLIALFVIIIFSITENINYKYTLPLIFISVIISIGNIKLLLISVIITILYTKTNIAYSRIYVTLLILGIAFTTIFIFNTNIQGYKENSVIHKENLESIKNYKEKNSQGNLILKKSINKKYKYITIDESEYYLNSFKKYYDLPQEVEIIFE